jgi:hypothetical protein
MVEFPTEREKLEKDVAPYRGKSADSRMQALLELLQLSEDLSAASGVRARQLALLAEREEEGHRRWRQLQEGARQFDAGAASSGGPF